MLDPFDFKEPRCAVCGGREFYAPKEDDPEGTIPVDRIMERLDKMFEKNDMAGAQSLLEHWENEARALKDRRGELSVVSELIGLYRKTGDKEKGLNAAARGTELVRLLELENTVSGATVLLNAATTLKAFGAAKKALPLYDEVYKVYSSHLDKNDVKMAGFYNNKALALQDAGEFEAAEECFKRALSIMEKAENGQPDLAVTYVNLAHLYEHAGKDKKAITDCLFAAYGLLTGEDIKKDGYYAFVLSKCAPSFKYFGYDIIAEEFIEESREIYARA